MGPWPARGLPEAGLWRMVFERPDLIFFFGVPVIDTNLWREG